MSHIWFKYKKISSRLNCYQWETCLSLRNIYKETYCISRIFLEVFSTWGSSPGVELFRTKGNWTRWSYKLNWTWILYIISVIIYWINVPTDQLTCSNCKAIPLKRGIKAPSFGMISIRMITMGIRLLKMSAITQLCYLMDSWTIVTFINY